MDDIGVSALAPLAWPAWAFACAFLTRSVAVAACRGALGVGRAWLVAYALWPVLFLLGTGLSALAGAGLAAFELTAAWLDPVYAPWGVPLLCGAPAVMLADALRGR
ncbi:hypothetical protein, partial [Caulobacter sp. 17J65-9]|uniref:hypothetical protein n=1 Tax=Caulobacter sp. 17J65-9 TaxID=2709382 RepID=UPI0013C56151